MKIIPATVLITTANNPPIDVPFLEMTNFLIRNITAKAALYFWIAQGIEKIVLADATATNLLSDDEIAELKVLGKQIEQVSYEQNSEIIKLKGKGYGEGLLIQYAIDNSAILQKEKYFFKCTGKTYVRNFPQLYELINNNKVSGIFWRHIEDGISIKRWADCRFYYTSTDFAKDYLIPAYLESDDKVSACEANIFQTLNTNMKMFSALRPLISGFSGGTGKEYFDVSFGHLDYNFPCWVTQN